MTETGIVPTEIRVSYREHLGWHLFTCKELPGLFVANKDWKLAFSDLPKAIRSLLVLDYRRDYEVFMHTMKAEEGTDIIFFLEEAGGRSL